jgi:hypothetical protein
MRVAVRQIQLWKNVRCRMVKSSYPIQQEFVDPLKQCAIRSNISLNARRFFQQAPANNWRFKIVNEDASGRVGRVAIRGIRIFLVGARSCN